MNHHTTTRLASAALLALATGSASADQVIADDLIVQFSACVGQDCVNGESFGFDTLRLKENNLRIKFDDTSASASFPNVDWQLTANDSSNGGLNKFSIEDISNARVPVTILASAPNNALFINASGNVGLGNGSPVVELHVTDGDTPTLRLEQNGSAGFTAQTWDLAGNETNFFVRDATHSSRLPFRIRANADDDSLYIDNDGQIGLFTDTPSAALHLLRSDGNAMLKVEEAAATNGARNIAVLRNKGRPDLVLQNTGTSDEWSIGGGTNLIFKQGPIDSTPNARATHFTLTNTGNLTITGSITTGGGTCGGGCDAVFSAGYDLPSITEHTERMYALGHLPNVGPTIENAPINVSDKLGRMLNELEHAHIYIGQLHAENAEQKAAIAALTDRLEALETRAVE